MSGTRSPSRTEPATDPRWVRTDGRPGWLLLLVLYPFTVGAAAINLFMLALIGRAVALPNLSPETAVLAALVLGVPLNWLAGRWIAGLLVEARKD
ncbi:MAG TPA: hypothetical protein PLL33_02535 [Paracoccus sp. (in: a-proteobacteria)]|nr:hypothetical protein [Paracoccus sp. (in: a-proteobacteria)]